MKWCASATAAVSVRRGPMTTSRPPRARIAFARPRKSGTVHRLPLLTIGFAPSTSRKSQRSMSGTGMLSQWPNISPLDSCLGIWSSVEAEKTFFVPIARARRGRYISSPSLCTFGLPNISATASRPWRSTIGTSRRSISAKASSQVAGTRRPSRRTSGVRRRSGSSCRSFSATPFGQM